MVVIYTIRVSLNTVGIELDASGRWVTLRRVYPNFARAAAERPARVTADRRSSAIRARDTRSLCGFPEWGGLTHNERVGALPTRRG